MASTFHLVFPNISRDDESTLETDKRVFAIVNAYIQSSSSATAIAAAQDIDSLFPTDPATKTIDYTSFEHLWEVFVGIAEQIPWNHPAQDKLVEVLKALRDLPDPRSMVIADWDEQPAKVWADMPVLAYVLSDGVESHGVIINDDSDAQKQSRIRDLNFQGFAARVTNAGVFDLSRLAVYRIRSVLEDDVDSYIPGYANVGNHFNVNIRPVDVWISLSAKLLFGLCKAKGEGADRNDIPGGKNWTGVEGFSVERWEFWKQKLDEIAGSQEASAETRETAKKIKATMIGVEA